MKICFLGPADNFHIEKWAKWFLKAGHQVHIISFTKGKIDSCEIHFIESGAEIESKDIEKIRYLFQASKVKKLIKKIKPDVINVHYATSYGTVAALAHLPAYYLSVWGSDVYDFPKKGILHREMLKFSLSHAKVIFSTSKAMATETSQYTDKDIVITPFGVDCNLFSPDKQSCKKGGSLETKNGVEYTIGTVKALEDKYGIATILRATAILKRNHPEVPVQLRIAGKGPQESEYKALAKELEIDNITHWLGFISQEQAAVEWANMDCGIIPSESESESFGVSAVEAQACCTPVIISDIPGLMEATVPGKTSTVVPRKSPEKLAQAMYEMYLDSNKRKEMGTLGRTFVENQYEIDDCFKQIEKIFISEYNRE